jgi:hypothetical protein
LQKLKPYLSKIKQGDIFTKQGDILTKPYYKLLKQGDNSRKMHVFHTKRCTSFGVKDVHLFFLKYIGKFWAKSLRTYS